MGQKKSQVTKKKKREGKTYNYIFKVLIAQTTTNDSQERYHVVCKISTVNVK